MSDERLLRDLARMARESQDAELDPLDERWDRLSAGELSADEEAELRALAQSTEGISDAYDAFRPLGADFRERVLRAVLPPEETGTPQESAWRSAADASPGTGSRSADPESRAPEPGKLLTFRRRRALWLGGGLAAAAVLALLMVRGPGPETGAVGLPAYVAELHGGVRELRSEDPEAGLTFPPGSRFELVLRPRAAVSGPVAARFFLARGIELRSWEVPIEVSPTGALRIAGTLGVDIDLEPGDWTVWAAVGRSGTLPGRDRLRALLAAPPPEASGPWILVRTELRVTAPR